MSVSSFSERFDSLMRNSMFADEAQVRKVQTAINSRLQAHPLETATTEVAQGVLKDISRCVSGLKGKKYLLLKRDLQQLLREERSRISETFGQVESLQRKRAREVEPKETRAAKKPKVEESSSRGENLELALRENGISENDIEIIRDGYLSNWRGFVKPDEYNPDLLQQTHGIKHLKVYKDFSTGDLIADYGIKFIGEGGSKRVKSGFRILSDGTLQPFVRYTVIEKTPLQRQRFFCDIRKELDIREQLGPTPYLLNITKAQYISKSGRIKNRYVSEKCDSNVYELIYEEKAKGIIPLPKSARQIDLAKKCCRDALESLNSMHTKGFVHLDVKPENILCKNGEGRLIDLVATCKANTAIFLDRGTPGYISPELLDARSENRYISIDPKMDMYAFGMTLLMILKPQLAVRLINAQYKVQDCNWAKEATVKYHSVLDDVRESLVNSSDKEEQFIASLLDPETKTRIDSQQALATFNTLFK